MQLQSALIGSVQLQ